MFSPEMGATNFSFASFFLSLDDSELLGSYSSSLAILFSLFGVNESLRIERFTLVVSNDNTNVLYVLIS